MNSRADIVAAIQTASSLAEQAELVTALAQYDADQRRVAADQRSIDLTDTIVRDTMTPVRVHEMHTASTDWLGSFEADADQNHLLAEAALWYGRVSPEVKEDPEEFMEQARGVMRRHASAYGERAAAAYAAGMEYLAFLHRREAASGLPQIDQTVAPDGVTPQPTPIPPDVFDNFAPPVNEDNAAVVGTETSERNPLLQEIQSQDGGQGQPEWGHGTWDESWGRTPNDAAPADPPTADDVNEDFNEHQASVALGYLYSMDDFRKDAASGLDQIQQTTAPDGVTDAPTPLPGDVMFPWTLGNENPQAEDEAPAQAAIEQAKQAALDELGGKCPSCDSPVEGMGKVKCKDCGLSFERQEKQSSGSEYKVGSKKTADMYGNSDAPHAVPQPNVANNPATTPHPTNSAADGREDASIGNASTTADGTVYRSYAEGYADGIAQLHQQDRHSVPSSEGGDNGTGLGNPKAASLKPRTSALFVSMAAAEDPEFRKGYAYASKWTPEVPMVKQGSAEFEAGLYAGISDNPAYQNAWVKAHRKWANKGVTELGQRIGLHATFTRKVATRLNKDMSGAYLVSEAATTTDLDTLDPSASPASDGTTPINGIGTPGPLDGGMDAAAPGGPSPYNGAEPFGQPVVPNGAPGPQGTPADKLVNDIPGGPLDGNARAAAFRRRVQANLLKMTKSDS